MTQTQQTSATNSPEHSKTFTRQILIHWTITGVQSYQAWQKSSSVYQYLLLRRSSSVIPLEEEMRIKKLTSSFWLCASASRSSSNSSMVTPGHAMGAVSLGLEQGILGLTRNPSRYLEWCLMSSMGPGKGRPSGIMTVPLGCNSME